MGDTLAIVERAIAFAATVVAMGAIVFRGAVVGRWTTPDDVSIARWNPFAAGVGALAAGALLLVAPARLYAQARNFVDAGDPVAPMMRNVLATTWGRGWSVQTVAGVVALVAFVVARQARMGWVLAAAAAMALTLAPALMGHAVAAEHWLALSLASDWAHVTAAGAWIGTLALLAAIIVSTRRDISALTVARSIELFHPVALASAAVLAASGVVSVFLRVDHISDVLHSQYGTILGVKLMLTLGVAAVGFHHSRKGVGLARLGGASAVARTLLAETAIATAVIGATALLVATSPPMPPMPGMKMGCASSAPSCRHTSSLNFFTYSAPRPRQPRPRP